MGLKPYFELTNLLWKDTNGTFLRPITKFDLTPNVPQYILVLSSPLLSASLGHPQGHPTAMLCLSCSDFSNRMFDDALCTLFSAPNYCYRCGNVAAILDVSATSEIKPITFDHTEVPEHDSPRPNARRQQTYFL